MSLPDKSSRETTKARNSVYQQLKVRNRSEKEIRTKLLQKEFSLPVIEKTIHYFKELDFIDDVKFARAWIQSRLKKPFGERRIHRELVDKGIAKPIIEAEFERATTHYSEDETVLALARKRWSKYTGVELQQRKRRLFEYLARRGFSAEAIVKAINRLNDT